MSPQLSCGNTCQIWTWYSICNQCFDNGEKSGNQRNGGNCFSNPHPRLGLRQGWYLLSLIYDNCFYQLLYNMNIDQCIPDSYVTNVISIAQQLDSGLSRIRENSGKIIVSRLGDCQEIVKKIPPKKSECQKNVRKFHVGVLWICYIIIIKFDKWNFM